MNALLLVKFTRFPHICVGLTNKSSFIFWQSNTQKTSQRPSLFSPCIKVCRITAIYETAITPQFEGLMKRYPKLTKQLDSPLVKPLRLVVMKIYLMVLFGYCLAPFVLLQPARLVVWHSSVVSVLFGSVDPLLMWHVTPSKYTRNYAWFISLPIQICLGN